MSIRLNQDGVVQGTNERTEGSSNTGGTPVKSKSVVISVLILGTNINNSLPQRSALLTVVLGNNSSYNLIME